jgi:hypothetical protein
VWALLAKSGLPQRFHPSVKAEYASMNDKASEPIDPNPAPPIAIDSHACPKVIDVNLTTQRLVAGECGRTFAATPITSGRPGLRTATGNYSIYFKEQDVHFYSPWPEGDPNYYPPMFVAYALEYLDGFFLHSDPDEPDSAFGQGSENGLYARNGCVHVPYSAMTKLFDWLRRLSFRFTTDYTTRDTA